MREARRDQRSNAGIILTETDECTDTHWAIWQAAWAIMKAWKKPISRQWPRRDLDRCRSRIDNST